MGFLLFILFLSVPLLEVWVLIEVGGLIGAGWTVALVVATAICGAALVRQQGLSVLRQMRNDMETNIFPIDSVFDGACLLVAGALLITPGFMTDALGLALLLPPLRRILQARIMARAHGAGASFDTGEGTGRGTGRSGIHGGGDIIDGEFKDVTGDGRTKDKAGDKAGTIEGPPVP